MRIALVFPGQGSQEVGMCKDFYEEFHAVQETFREADKALSFPISRLMLEGPEDELVKTQNAQPAILTASYAIFNLLKEFLEGNEVVAFAGHSLGEYTALVCAGSLDFADALRLVHLRGKFMQEAVPLGEGMMIAVIGLNQAEVEEVLRSLTSFGTAEIANLNAPDQIVVSGSRLAVEKCVERLKNAGAKRVVELKVSAPFHSSLMKSAEDALAPYLRATRFSPPVAPVYSNVSASAYPDDLAEFPELLINQITAPVRWVEEIEAIWKSAVRKPNAFFEVGAGKTLQGLIKRIVPDAPCFSINSLESFKSVLPILTGEKKI